VNPILENVALAPLTTFGIGGPARYYLDAFSEDDVYRGLEFAASKRAGVFVMGGGSNLLVSDGGIDALVLRVCLRRVSFEDVQEDLTIVTAGAGEDWDVLVQKCVDRNLAGVECLSGIPGYVGGTPVQNVGAYGQEVSETIVSVRCLDRVSGLTMDLNNEQCGFSYRSSIFNGGQRDRYIVLGVKFALRRGAAAKIVYRDLIDHFTGRTPNVNEVRDAVLKIRRSKSMVIDPADPNSRSAGSFFKNPVLDPARFSELKATFKTVPSFSFGENVKIPAAWLIENAGFGKGFALRNAGLSTKHTLAIVNLGNATADEIIELKTLIQDRVAARFGIRLVPEPVFAGFDGAEK
jgi:UDP-N-acetylmuramate dehydrogenase